MFSQMYVILSTGRCTPPGQVPTLGQNPPGHSNIIRQIEQKKITKKIGDLTRDEPRSLAQLSGTLTITLNCFVCLCEAIIESYSCMGDSVQLV